ncbi:hypothetical protein [Mycobacterium sp. DL99]|uniref:hypothetical protein n=1 Tax=Mycobacterium sp. DL99 TaxID=2528957 RepID=UPI0010803E34|nr:hypothetical protein [Mycobacterium sp. DL99]
MQFSGASEWAFWGGAAIVIAGILSGIFLNDRRLGRRTYWLSWLAGGLLMILAARMQNPDRALGIAGFSAAMSVMMAFFRTPYLKIGNTIYAASSGDRRPDPPADDGEADGPADSYGKMSAPTLWWLLAILVGASALLVWVEGWAGSPIIAAAIFALCAGVIGFVDMAGGFPRFRRQYVPAAVLAVASIPLYCAPALLYLLCYEIGRWLKG